MAKRSNLPEEDEDFTFPTGFNGDQSPSNIDSPPLWHLSPARHYDSEEDCFPSKGPKIGERKSFSGLDNREEKMDMLWEDLNEELTRSRSLKMEPRGATITKRTPLDDMGVSLGCSGVRSTRLAKSEKKPNVLTFIKVLKKLLRLQNSHRSTKSRSRKS